MITNYKHDMGAIKKDVVIVADFVGALDGSSNSRFLYLAELLAKNNDVEVITSDFDHGSKSYLNSYNVSNRKYKITLLHEGSYPTNVCLRRFHAHYVWGKNVRTYLKTRKKPDVVYCAVPTLKAAKEVSSYCRKNNIKFIIDIQDLWPEAFQMVFDIPLVSDVAFAPFKRLADEIYRKADVICAVSDTYCQRAAKINSNAKCITVFLGTDLQTFDKYALQSTAIEKPKDEIWLAYCGTLGSSYDLTCVIDALAIVNNPKLNFVVMGDGPRANEFEKYATNKAVKTQFKGRLPYNEMCSLLKACDIAVNPITHGAAQSIINKHADYAAAGIPVVSTQESEEYRTLVKNYQMGLNCHNNNAPDLAEKIEILVKDEALRKKMGRNARVCAEERFDRKITYKKLCELI